MTKIRDFFKNNLGLKLLSLAIALLLWLLVVNVSRPEVTDYKTVKLEVENADIFESENKTWELDGRETVTVYYKVRTDQQRRISASDFRAYIDLKDYSITGSVPVYVEVLNDKSSLIEDVTVRPQVVRVLIEDIQQKKFELGSKVIGKAAEGYTVSDVIVSPESVYVTGPESEIGKISGVGIEVPVSELTETADGVAQPVFYDANGNPISLDSRVSVSREQIEYTATIHKIKEVNLVAHITGTPAAGYQYEATTVSPASIRLSAVEAVIDKLSVLNLPQINIAGASSNITREVELGELLPAGVELEEPGSKAVVTVRIVQVPQTQPVTTEATESSAEEETEERETTERSTETRESSAYETKERESSGDDISSADAEEAQTVSGSETQTEGPEPAAATGSDR